MDRNQFRDKERKVGGSTSVKIYKNYLSSEYEVKMYCEQEASDTGLVKFCELIPRHLHLPKFIFRWDERGEALDVDIHINGKPAKKLWNESGYSGHHPQKIEDKGYNRGYNIDIKIPGRQIFLGVIDIGLSFELKIKDSIFLSDQYQGD